MNSYDLSGKIALVTGGTGALGASICRSLAQGGATVLIMARSRDRAEALATSIQAEGLQAYAFSCDVLDKAALEILASEIKWINAKRWT